MSTADLKCPNGCEPSKAEWSEDNRAFFCVHCGTGVAGMREAYYKESPTVTKPPAKPQASKVQQRNVREYEIIESDRVSLLHEANELVQSMVYQRTAPLVGSVPLTVHLSEVEQQAYDSALSYMTRQFDQGYKDTEPHEQRVEVDDTVEYSGDGK